MSGPTPDLAPTNYVCSSIDDCNSDRDDSGSDGSGSDDNDSDSDGDSFSSKPWLGSSLATCLNARSPFSEKPARPTLSPPFTENER